MPSISYVKYPQDVKKKMKYELRPIPKIEENGP